MSVFTSIHQLSVMLLPLLEYTAEIITLNTVMVPFCAYLYFFFEL